MLTALMQRNYPKNVQKTTGTTRSQCRTKTRNPVAIKKNKIRHGGTSKEVLRMSFIFTGEIDY